MKDVRGYIELKCSKVSYYPVLHLPKRNENMCTEMMYTLYIDRSTISERLPRWRWW